MDELENNVTRMMRDGISDAEIDNYIKSYQPRTTETPPNVNMTSGPMLDPGASPAPPIREQSGQPPQPNQFRDLAASAVRYGLPVAAGVAFPQLSLPAIIGQAVLAGGSEITARMIERTGSDPTLDTLWSDIEAGGITGAIDLGVNMATRGLGAAFRFVGDKLFIPSEAPLSVQLATNTVGNRLSGVAPEIRTAQETLGKLPGEAPDTILGRFSRWMKSKSAARPFSLTYGQINGEEKNFIGWLEGMARAGIGSKGKMTKFDLRNERAVIDAVENYVHERASKATAPDFAMFAKRIIGEVDDPGEMFEPVIAYRKYLYKKFEDGLVASGGTVDGTALRKYIREGGTIEGGLPLSIYSQLRSQGLVPPLEPSAIKRTTTTRVSTTKKGGSTVNEQSDTINDITKTDLLDPNATPVNTQTRLEKNIQGKREIDNAAQYETTRLAETFGGQTEQEIAAEWAAIPAKDTDKIIKFINHAWEDGKTQHNNVLKYMGDKIEQNFMKLIRSDPNLSQIHDAADTFFKKEVGFTRNSAIKGMQKALTENPSKALALLGGSSKTPVAREVYDRLMRLKQALHFSAATPTQAVPHPALSNTGIIHTPTSAATFPGNKQAAQLWDRAFLEPIRYNMLTRNIDTYGSLKPRQFLQMLNANDDVPEFFNEVFGGAAQVEHVKKLMTTLSVLQQAPREKNIYIQLAQAGAIGGAFGGVSQAIFSDEVTITGAAIGAGVGVMVGPYALAKMLTNAELIRSFTDGLTQGIRSSRLAIALRKLGEMGYVSNFVRDNPTEDAVNFYTTIPQDQMGQEQQ